MKCYNLIRILAISVCFIAFMSACGSHDHGDAGHHDHQHEATGTEHSHAVHGDGEAYTSAYVCPMHCVGSGSDEAGYCPVCDMKYVALETHTKDGHAHE